MTLIRLKRWLWYGAIFIFLCAGQIKAQSAGAFKDSVARYLGAGRMDKALKFAQKRADAEKEEKGVTSIDFANALRSYGDLLSRSGFVDEASKQLDMALPIYEATGTHAGLAIMYQTYALHQFSAGNYALASEYYSKAFQLKQLQPNLDSAEVALYYDNMGTAAYQMGRYADAETWLWQAFNIRRRRYGELSPAVATSQNNLGNFYRFIGDYAKANQGYSQAIEVFKQTSQTNQALAALYLTNLGSNLRSQKRWQEALRVNLAALELKQSMYAATHPELAVSYNSLGCVYADLNGFHKAALYFAKALEVFRSRLPDGHPDITEVELNLATVWSKTGQLRQADSLLNKVMVARHKSFGPKTPLLSPVVKEKALLAIRQYKQKEAFEYLHQLSELYSYHLQQNFPFMSTIEKEKFRSSVAEYQDLIQGYYAANANQLGHTNKHWLQHQINTKGLLLQSQHRLVKNLRNAPDSSIRQKTIAWIAQKEIYNKMLSGNLSASEASLAALETQLEATEKWLIRQSNLPTAKPAVNLKQLRTAMKKRDCLVEVVRVRKPGLVSTTDTTFTTPVTYSYADLTDTVRYVALIFTKARKLPIAIDLGPGEPIEGSQLTYYRKAISLRLNDTLSYQWFWQKIASAIPRNCKVVYLVPDGVYHFINLATLKQPAGGGFLGEKLEFRTMTNASDLLNHEQSNSKNQETMLIGYPDFDGKNLKPESERSRSQSSEIILRRRYGFIQTELFLPLPGTLDEVQEIARIFRINHLQVNVLTRDSAMEERVKQVNQPRILHFATHGFFFNDTSDLNQVLFRTGVVLSGANQNLSNMAREGEDGILTAYEAMNLNLDNTDLVVLSACETGLGEVKNGEGVYGLQRAFKVAGAKSIIMSLWKVDDEATQELMVSFYKNWLENHPDSLELSGRSKRQAFLAAQKELKARYPDPYYWGAFVMVGE